MPFGVREARAREVVRSRAFIGVCPTRRSLESSAPCSDSRRLCYGSAQGLHVDRTDSTRSRVSPRRRPLFHDKRGNRLADALRLKPDRYDRLSNTDDSAPPMAIHPVVMHHGVIPRSATFESTRGADDPLPEPRVPYARDSPYSMTVDEHVVHHHAVRSSAAAHDVRASGCFNLRGADERSGQKRGRQSNRQYLQHATHLCLPSEPRPNAANSKPECPTVVVDFLYGSGMARQRAAR
jgi:hypothetical protein